MFNRQLSRNVSADPRVMILAVDSSKPMWLRSLLGSRFVRPPGVRLAGTVGPPRPSRPEEVAHFHRAVGPMRHLPGARAMWANLSTVRDLSIDEIVPLRLGRFYSGTRSPAEGSRK